MDFNGNSWMCLSSHMGDVHLFTLIYTRHISACRFVCSHTVAPFGVLPSTRVHVALSCVPQVSTCSGFSPLCTQVFAFTVLPRAPTHGVPHHAPHPHCLRAHSPFFLSRDLFTLVSVSICPPVCTGCTAKSSEAIWASDLRKVRVTIQFLEVGSHSFYVADIYRKSGSYQKFENK